MTTTVGNSIKFYRVASMALFSGLTLEPGAVYEVTVDATNGIISWFRALTITTYEAILQNAIASAMGINAYVIKKGSLGVGGTVTALPTTGVAIGDTYEVITAATYGGIVCVVGDHIRAKTASPVAWEKKNGCASGRTLNYYDTLGQFKTVDLSTMTVSNSALGAGAFDNSHTGSIVGTDTIEMALSKLQNAVEDYAGNFQDYLLKAGGTLTGPLYTPDVLISTLTDLEVVNKKQVVAYVASQLTSMISLKGDIANNTALQALTGLKKGDAYRIPTAGLYDGIQCEPGDVIYVLDTTAGTTGALVNWSVLQNNIDIATICALLGANSDASKMLTNLVLTGGQLVPTYSQLQSRTLAGFTLTETYGNPQATDTLAQALSRIVYNAIALDARVVVTENQLKWIEITA